MPEARGSGEPAISLVNMTAAWSGGQPAGIWSELDDLETAAGLGALADGAGDVRQRR